MATPTPTKPTLTRRTFLIGAVGVGVAGTLAPGKKPKTVLRTDTVGLRDVVSISFSGVPGQGLYADTYSNIY